MVSHCFFCPVLMGTLQPQNSSSKVQGWPCLSCSTQILQLSPPNLPMPRWVRKKEQLAANQMEEWSFPAHESPVLPVLAQRKQLQPQIRKLHRSLHSPSISLRAFLWTIQKRCLITFSSLRSKWVNLPKYAIHSLVSEVWHPDPVNTTYCSITIKTVQVCELAGFLQADIK